jgi:hypothetical protein
VRAFLCGFKAVPLAILLADDGPSPELEHLIAAFDSEGGYHKLVARLRDKQ